MKNWRTHNIKKNTATSCELANNVKSNALKEKHKMGLACEQQNHVSYNFIVKPPCK